MKRILPLMVLLLAPLSARAELSPLVGIYNMDNVLLAPGLLTWPACGASCAFRPMGVLYTTTATAATTTGTGEQILGTYSLPANALDQAGRRLRIRASFLYAGNTNNKTVKLYFGSSVITTATAASNGTNAYLELSVVRSGASTQLVWGTGMNAATPVTTYANVSSAETDTAAIVIKATGTDGTSSASDITLVDFAVEYMN